jgi:hypothetical protein
MTAQPMSPQFIQSAAALVAAYAALCGGIWAVVTRPLENRLGDVVDRLKRIEDKLDSYSELERRGTGRMESRS